MSGEDYPPPGQHTITDFTGEQDHAEASQQNVPLDNQTMPQPQQNIPTSQQPMPQMQYMQMVQVQPMPQQQYVMGGQTMPPRQQYVQQMPRQYYQPQQQMPGQQMPQYYQQLPRQYYQQQQMPQYYQPMPGQLFPGGGSQPMPGGMIGQTPPPFVNLQLQPWTTELCDCTDDVENCLITTFFPCITIGQIAELTDRGMTTSTSAGLTYLLLLCFTGCHWAYSWMYRTRLRAAYSLLEDPCCDCLVHFFCDPCALCQEYRKLKNRGFNMNLGNMQLKAQQEAAASVPPPVQGMIR